MSTTPSYPNVSPYRLLPLAFLSVALLVMTGCSTPDAEPAGEADAQMEQGPNVLASGGPFRGINGILFGPDGRLYLASVVTPAVAAIDKDTGEILTNWGPDEGAAAPDDLAFGPDGSVYWTDISIGTVTKRTPDGVSQVIADLGPGPNPITFSDDGRLFVSQCFMDTNLYELDPTGETEPRLIRDDLGPGCGLNGMDWGSADGKLYGPRWFRGEVARVDVDSGEIESVASGFGVPAAVKFDSKGRLHVLDALEGQVVRVDLESGAKEVVANIQPGLDNLAFDDSDRLFVSSFADGFIVEVLGPNENRTVLEGGINMPGGLTMHGGQLYLADFFALRALDPATGQEKSVVRDVIGFSELGSVMSVHSAGENLILTSWFDNAVKVWDPVGQKALAVYQAAAPIDALEFEGKVVASEYGTGQIVRFEEGDGRTVLAAGLDGPAGLAVSGGNLYATEHGAGRVLQIVREGELLEEVGVLAEGLDGPEGIVVVPGQDGGSELIYVVEAGGGRVVRFSVDGVGGSGGGEDIEVVAEGLETQVPASGGFPETMLFNGIEVSGGVVYVSGDRKNLVYGLKVE